MNVNFSLVWFEDEDEYYTSYLPDVEQLIKKNCLVPIIHRYKSNIEELEILSKADLILADYDLGTSNSVDIIKNIRNNDIVTDVLFYSSKPQKLINGIKSADPMIEGFFYKKRGSADFMDKIELLINRVVKRNENIENLRGLLMEHTAIFDKCIFDSILRFCSNEQIMSNTLQYINSKIATNYKERTFGTCSKTCNIENCNDCRYTLLKIENISEIEKFDSIIRCRILYKILKEKNLKQFGKFYTEYENEIIHYRNAFAHQFSNNSRIYIANKKVYEDINQSLFQKIRNSISKFIQVFDSIAKINQ